MNNKSIEQIVRGQKRWVQSLWPLVIATTGLAATLALGWHWHPSLSRVEKWGSLPQWWAAGVVVTLGISLLVWNARRKSLALAAALLDEEFQTKNRLEAATVLRSENHPLARAQRAEAGQFVSSIQRKWHYAPVLTTLRTLVILLVIAHCVTLLSWARPWSSTAGDSAKLTASAKKQETNSPIAKVEKSAPKASIEWESPESETRATAIEEVPLKATANSACGLQDAVLEIAVNGEPRLKVPLADDALKTPGSHPLAASIYLDQLEVKAFDIVSYAVRAHRIDLQPLPDTVSDMQFIQVKPPREDVFQCDCKGPSQCFNYIAAIKAAQLKLMKENHVLANSDLSKTSESWKTENHRVAADQKELADKTTEVIAKFTENGTSENVVSLIREAQPLMVTAAENISAEQNDPALATQGRALSLITEVEKFLKDKISQAQCKVPKVEDPFKKQRNAERKKRPPTKAEQLELLARAQSQLAGDLANPAAAAATTAVEKKVGSETDDQISGTPDERETQIIGKLGELIGEQSFGDEANEHLGSGRKQAQASAWQMAASNLAAAAEPAAESARELKLAVTALKHSGDQIAKNELADALRALNRASDLVRSAPKQNSDQKAQENIEAAAQAAAQAAEKVANAAAARQETGSTNNAARLADLAQLMNGEALKQALADLKMQPRNGSLATVVAARLDQLGEQTARQRNQGGLSRAELARLADQLERANANLQRLAAAGKSANQNTNQNSSQGGSQPAPQAANKPASSPTSSPGKTGSGKTPGSSPGTAAAQSSGSSAGGDGTMATVGGQSEQLALALADDLREGALDALAVVPDSKELATVRELLRRIPQDNGSGNVVVEIADDLQPPLTGLVKLLRTELARSARQHQLADQEKEQPLPAYRPAVANYFERLSLDYQTNSAHEVSKK